MRDSQAGNEVCEGTRGTLVKEVGYTYLNELTEEAECNEFSRLIESISMELIKIAKKDIETT